MNFKQNHQEEPVSVLDAVSVGLPRKFDASEAEPFFRRAIELAPKDGVVRPGSVCVWGGIFSQLSRW